MGENSKREAKRKKMTTSFWLVDSLSEKLNIELKIPWKKLQKRGKDKEDDCLQCEIDADLFLELSS